MSPFLLRTLRCMVLDTFRQSLASRLFYGMLALTLVATLLCISVRVSGSDRLNVYDPARMPSKQVSDVKGPADVAIVESTITIGFGLMEVPSPRYRDEAVRYLQIVMAGAVAGTVGVLLALLWTAGFLPSFLEPQSATVLLAKPPPRGIILLGKYLGVILFVAVQAAIFIATTWVALGFATGVWNFGYWLALPLLVLHFAIFYSVSTFLAVATRSTIACAFGTLMVWLLCWLINFSYLRQSTTPDAPSKTLTTIMYWLAPKPMDLEGLFFHAMRAEGFSEKDKALEYAEAAGALHPELSAMTSLVVSLLILAAAMYEFKHIDY